LQENGYQLLFLSARSILQASQTRQFLISLKQVIQENGDIFYTFVVDGLPSSSQMRMVYVLAGGEISARGSNCNLPRWTISIFI